MCFPSVVEHAGISFETETVVCVFWWRKVAWMCFLDGEACVSMFFRTFELFDTMHAISISLAMTFFTLTLASSFPPFLLFVPSDWTHGSVWPPDYRHTAVSTEERVPSYFQSTDCSHVHSAVVPSHNLAVVSALSVACSCRAECWV